MAAVRQGMGSDQRGTMSKRSAATCDDCYFRQAGLCALPGNAPCPTFRGAAVGRLVPPTQPRLVLRAPVAQVAHAASA
jgi:hypothetical protein